MEGKQKGQKAGFLLNLLFGKSGYKTRTKKVDNTLRIARKSESNLIESYENLASVSRQYYEDYNKHLENLITLDDINGMSGLQTTFKNVVISKLFKGTDTVDRKSPLLLKNYLVTGETAPKNFRKEHLLAQIRFILAGFAVKDTLLISQYDVSLENNNAIIKFFMINGDTYDKSVPVDANFNMNLSKLESELRDVIKSMKKKMNYEIEIDDNFELMDIDLELPGLEFSNPETALERKIRALKPSIKVGSEILATEKPDKGKSAKNNKPVWQGFKQPHVTPSVKKISVRKQKSRGREASFKGTNKPGQLEKKPANEEQVLQELLEKKPVIPQEEKKNNERRRRPDNREMCEQITEKNDCNKNRKCYYSNTQSKCFKKPPR